jgi:hypothetical protein
VILYITELHDLIIKYPEATLCLIIGKKPVGHTPFNNGRRQGHIYEHELKQRFVNLRNPVVAMGL